MMLVMYHKELRCTRTKGWRGEGGEGERDEKKRKRGCKAAVVIIVFQRKRLKEREDELRGHHLYGRTRLRESEWKEREKVKHIPIVIGGGNTMGAASKS